jgi:hypothetical protein
MLNEQVFSCARAAVLEQFITVLVPMSIPFLKAFTCGQVAVKIRGLMMNSQATE